VAEYLARENDPLADMISMFETSATRPDTRCQHRLQRARIRQAMIRSHLDDCFVWQSASSDEFFRILEWDHIVEL